jgi:hypothetical protein
MNRVIFEEANRAITARNSNHPDSAHFGHSRSRARASYPSCVAAYPRGSRARVFYFLLSNFYLRL